LSGTVNIIKLQDYIGDVIVVKQPEFLWIGMRTKSPGPCPGSCGFLPKL
jgi:hypothetical protein